MLIILSLCSLKTLSPRKIGGFDSHSSYTIPRLEHVKDHRYDQYTVNKRHLDAFKSSTLADAERSEYKVSIHASLLGDLRAAQDL